MVNDMILMDIVRISASVFDRRFRQDKYARNSPSKVLTIGLDRLSTQKSNTHPTPLGMCWKCPVEYTLIYPLPSKGQENFSHISYCYYYTFSYLMCLFITFFRR